MRPSNFGIITISLLLVVCIGVFGVGSVHAQATSANNTSINNTTVPQDVSSTETVGYWGGVWHNETFSFDNKQSAYLNQTQLSKLTNRTIARIEYLRNDTFDSRPPVRVLTRTEYQRGSTGYSPRNGSFETWNNIIWKAAFIVDENTNVENELKKLYGGQVRAFYSPSKDSIYLIVSQDQTELVKFKSTSLAHELVHAYQDQKFGLTSEQFQRQTQDGSLAKDSVIEGEATLLESRFKQKCETRSWSCYLPANAGSTTDGAEINVGLQLTAYFPYSDGIAYIKHKYQNGGWENVNESYYHPPTHTSEVIHYGETGNPVIVQVNDNSSKDWSQFSHGVNGRERVGEATLAMMFWYQNYQYGINTGVTNRDLFTTRDISEYNYDFKVSNGLRGDAIVPYKNSEENETGYIFKTVWESDQDKNQFKEGYERILDGHGGEKYKTNLNGTVYKLPNDSGFSGVYYITETNQTLTITHSDSLHDIKNIQGITKPSQNLGEPKQSLWERIQELIEETSIFTLAVVAGSFALLVGFGVKIALFN